MHKALIVIDGTDAAEAAVREVVREARRGRVDGIHLLNVQPCFDGYVAHFVGARAIREYQRAAGETALAGARRILDSAGLSYDAHIRAGESASVILRVAHELQAEEIVISADSGGFVGSLLQRFLVSRVIRGASVPVVAVHGAAPALAFSSPQADSS